MHCVNVSSIHEFTQRALASPVMEVLCYSASNQIRNGILFDFYPRLPHILTSMNPALNRSLWSIFIKDYTVQRG